MRARAMLVLRLVVRVFVIVLVALGGAGTEVAEQGVFSYDSEHTGFAVAEVAARSGSASAVIRAAGSVLEPSETDGVLAPVVVSAPLERTSLRLEGANAPARATARHVYDSSVSFVAPSATHLDEAASAANGVRLNAQLAADEIAGGHAYVKHVVERGEFPGIQTRAQFADMIETVITDYSDIAHMSGGRTTYWRDGVVVIRHPSAVDGGTAFVPTDGYAYFETIN